MRWVTRERPKTDRIACPWLIRRFIDPDAEILYVPRDEVLATAATSDAHSFDAPGAAYTHRGNQCTFEVLIDEFGLRDDPALVRLAAIVHAADIAGDIGSDPLGPGLLAIGEGGLDAEPDDHRLLARGSFVYDALYAWCRRQMSPLVVFVCEHGAAKSVVAAEVLKRMAGRDGLSLHAVARGVEPDDELLPAAVAGLLAEGIQVHGVRPRPLDSAELAAAWRVVVIGAAGDAAVAPGVPVMRWDDVPPVSAGYAAARDAIGRHLTELLTEATGVG